MMGAPTDNVFDYFGSDLEEIFKINREGVETLADAYNESGCGTPIRQFIKATERHVDPELAELYLFRSPPSRLIITWIWKGRSANCWIQTSSTDQKGNPVLLLKAERTRIVRVAGPIPRHRELSELPALEDVAEREELIQINDCGAIPRATCPRPGSSLPSAAGKRYPPSSPRTGCHALFPGCKKSTTRAPKQSRGTRAP